MWAWSCRTDVPRSPALVWIPCMVSICHTFLGIPRKGPILERSLKRLDSLQASNGRLLARGGTSTAVGNRTPANLRRSETPTRVSALSQHAVVELPGSRGGRVRSVGGRNMRQRAVRWPAQFAQSTLDPIRLLFSQDGRDAITSMKRDALPLVERIWHWSKHRRCRSSANANDS